MLNCFSLGKCRSFFSSFDGNCFLVVFNKVDSIWGFFFLQWTFFFDEKTVKMAKFASCCGIKYEFEAAKNDIKTNVVEKFMQFQWNTN